MPEESKKNQQKKNKNEPRDQRKPRQSRHQSASATNKGEKKIEEPKVVVQPEKPVHEEPGPEFYKNLKRETDEILKITEEANSKYRNKEIKSNWTKYEMPIESYEEMEEQENMGADYEKLIQAPLSIGGHFQFKHEKSWSTETEPSIYDKYFEINMDNLAIAVSTIPFYERNNINKSIFSETDILNMENRSTKYKQKYYNDKTYTTPELETQEKILNTLKENLNKTEGNIQDNVDNENIEVVTIPIGNEEKKPTVEQDFVESTKQDLEIKERSLNLKVTDIEVANKTESINDVNTTSKNNVDNEDNDIDSLLLKVQNKIITFPVKEPIVKIKKDEISVQTKQNEIVTNIIDKEISTVNKKVNPTETKNPVIETPEDLEKWLDDFLDN